MPLYSKDFLDIKTLRIATRFGLTGIAILCLIFTLTLPSTSRAQDLFENKPVPGMKKMVITPVPPQSQTQAPPAPQAMVPPPPEDGEKNDPPQQRQPLEPEKALLKQQALKQWSFSKPALANTERDVDQLLKDIESHAELASPQILLLSAKALFDHGHKEEAAKYFFVAQARLKFDQTRWPGDIVSTQEEIKYMNSGKSSDQKLPTSAHTKRRDPHASLVNLSSAISPDILQWTLSNNKRFLTAITQAQEWDEATALGYKPEYDIQTPAPYKHWADMLVHTRSAYYTELINLQKNMQKFKGAKN
ncbi:MAG: hypothetical protein RBR86_05180 [Pseudobdellovibrionaceae bacterium]|jgi:hypothetical protein|nr:hypothetical protein [Pseudobdellovibrionaceae bacterium]